MQEAFLSPVAAAVPAPEKHDGAAAAASSIDERQYLIWGSQSASEALRVLFWVLFVVRVAQVGVMCGDRPWLVSLAFVVLLFRAMVVEYVRPKSTDDLTSVQALHRWWTVQFFLVVSTPTFAIYAYFVPQGSDEMFAINHMGATIMQGALLNLPRSWYLKGVVPVNVAAYLAHGYLSAQLSPTWVLRLLFAAGVSYYVYWQRDRNLRSLYLARAASERARDVAEEERNRTEAWRAAFRGVLDSVFDASCVCDAQGRVQRSTPHLDELLAPGGSAGLGGGSLLAFAADEAEGERLQHFLAELPAAGAARRLQLRLRRRPAAGEAVAFEACISGIRLPAAAAGGKPQCPRPIFLGVELAPGAEAAAEPPLGPEGADAAELLLEALDRGREAGAEAEAEERLSAHEPRCALHRGGSGGRGARSCLSAPTVLLEEEAVAECEDGADCLPPDALVWTEGRNAPTRVAEVEVGSRLLCFDHLTGGMRFAQVTEAAVLDASQARWVEVELEDGTTVKMTAEHPVFPAAAGTDSLRTAAVKAEDLKPMQHTLRVFKAVPLAVRRVRGLGGGAGPAERVSLSVAQPGRHSVFAAAAGGAAGVALASATVETGPARGRSYGGFRVKNTFLDGIEDEDFSCAAGCTCARRKRRLITAPNTEPLAGDLAARSDSEADDTLACKAAPAPSVSGASCRSRRAGSECSSKATWLSSAPSAASSAEAAAQVLLGGGGPADRFQAKLVGQEDLQAAKTVVLLSRVAQARAKGLRSVGSAGHAEGWCMPCLMEHWHQVEGADITAPCRMGLLCNRCHECHTEGELREVRRLRRQQERRQASSRKQAKPTTH